MINNLVKCLLFGFLYLRFVYGIIEMIKEEEKLREKRKLLKWLKERGRK